jgi:hypothetical protein
MVENNPPLRSYVGGIFLPDQILYRNQSLEIFGDNSQFVPKGIFLKGAHPVSLTPETFERPWPVPPAILPYLHTFEMKGNKNSETNSETFYKEGDPSGLWRKQEGGSPASNRQHPPRLHAAGE